MAKSYIELCNEIRAKLKVLAAREKQTDENDFNAFDFSGGNYDDCYWGGVEDGETGLARQLLKEFFEE